tara:strand:+ start:6 stop:1985 length:1980 start_codon:yes stop_codon:yes gene_type:complete
MKVPYRNFKTFKGIANYSGRKKNIEIEIDMFVRDYDLDPKNDMNLIKDFLKKSKSYSEMPLFRGLGQTIDIKDLSYITKRELNKDKFILLKNANIIRQKISQFNESKSQKSLRIALLGFNNNEIILSKLKNHLKRFIPERSFEFYIPAFGQFIKEIIDKKSNLNKTRTFLRIFTLNYIDLQNLSDEKDIYEFIDKYLEYIIKIHKLHGGWSFVNLFFNNIYENDYKKNKLDIYLVNKINIIIIEKLSSFESIIIIDPITLISTKQIKINDSSLWYLGRFQYSDKFCDEITYEWAKIIISILEKKIRLIIVDLDNTLWGGVLGEDDVCGIKIGGDYPGNAYYDFQKELIKLRSKGIALAISSKNDMALVKKAFKSLKEMPMDIKMFSTYSVGWHEKVIGIREISKKLNLGLYSILFIDDNEAEIEKVRNKYPEIKVLHLPKDPSQYVNELKNCPYIKSIQTNKEDIMRIKSFENLINFKDNSKNETNLNDYLSNLKINVYFNDLSNSNISRAIQLAQKTNQFNSTSIRLTKSEILDFNKKEKKVIVIGHEAKDSDYENIGLMIIEENHADLEVVLKLYLLSCRVLGRGLEKNCLKYLANEYLNKGFIKLNAELIKNERNKPTHRLFDSLGFINKKENIWELLLKEKFSEPKYLKIYDKRS